MKAVVVYESMYGNTHEIASAIGEGLDAFGDAVVVALDRADAELVRSADLLVVGGPTHVHGMSRASTRQAAVAAAAEDDALEIDPDAPGPGLRGWLDDLDVNGRDVAAFDTRMHGPPALTGRASKGIARRLRHGGAALVAEPESFLVTKENQLDPHEHEHARAWGRQLGARTTERTSPA